MMARTTTAMAAMVKTREKGGSTHERESELTTKSQ
jgi:hypothetical protein